jgi:hypothetical protein
MKKLFYRIYTGLALFNVAMAVFSLAGVLFFNATWHIATFLVALWLAFELFSEARREKNNPETEKPNDILKKELWNRTNI